MDKSYYRYTGKPSDDGGCVSKKEVQLRDYFRLLWEQHVYWTRMVILGIVYDLPDLEQTTNRLLRNVPDFVKIFSRFYGKSIATEFGRLLKAHLVIAGELVQAAKAGDSKMVADAERRWYANANEIVYFLNHINPYWSIETMRVMWYQHLSLTEREAVAAIHGDYTKSIELFDQIEKEALIMADEFTEGVIYGESYF